MALLKTLLGFYPLKVGFLYTGYGSKGGYGPLIGRPVHSTEVIYQVSGNSSIDLRPNEAWKRRKGLLMLIVSYIVRKYSVA